MIEMHYVVSKLIVQGPDSIFLVVNVGILFISILLNLQASSPGVV